MGNKLGRICFVVQRYGDEVNGGAELHCKQLAERMTQLYDVDVYTTKAVDYMTWKNVYTEDYEVINGVNVYRFDVDAERDIEEFNQVLGRFLSRSLPVEEEQVFIDKQGPYCPKLIRELKNNSEQYKAILFFTYLYYQTVMGITEVKDKAILFSLAHNEPFHRLQIMKQVFNAPRAFFFNTDEERKLVRGIYKNYNIPYLIGGVGVDVPEDISAERFKKKYHLDNFITYIGRIDIGKNVPELFDFFKRYKNETNSDLKLVLMGKEVIKVPEDENIVSLGFVSDQDKFDGLAAAKLLVLPSIYESLSMVVLEAFSLKKPVLVNGNCEVLKAHCEKSDAGFYYYEYSDFKEGLSKLENDVELCKVMGNKGKSYVEQNYKWNLIVNKLSYLIEYIQQQ